MRLVTYRRGRSAPRLGALWRDGSQEVVLDLGGLAAGLAEQRGTVRRPEGVGAATGRFLRAGGRIEAALERIGVLVNQVVAP